MIEAPTRVPELVAELHSRATTALPNAAVVVGPPTQVADLGQRTVLVIGFPSDGAESVTTTVERAQGLGHRYVETFEIRCLASVVSGETDPAPLLTAARAVVAAVESIVKATPGLTVADMAGLGPSMRWAIGQTPEGAGVEVVFSVVGQAAL